MHLYELKQEWNEVYNLIDNATENGLDDQTILDTLESIQGEIQDKAVSIACVIKDIANDIAGYKAEEARLAEKRKSLERNAERLKTYLKLNLIQSGLTKITDKKANISLRNFSSVKITDESSFIEWAQENGRDDLLSFSVSVSKTAVKQSLETGAELPGASVVNNPSVIIK